VHSYLLVTGDVATAVGDDWGGTFGGGGNDGEGISVAVAGVVAAAEAAGGGLAS
jgi:hypothetical protein